MRPMPAKRRGALPNSSTTGLRSRTRATSSPSGARAIITSIMPTTNLRRRRSATLCRPTIKTINLESGCHLNVDHDDNLKVTKVWMNCVVRDGRDVVGVLGTGVDLSQFIREVV